MKTPRRPLLAGAIALIAIAPIAIGACVSETDDSTDAPNPGTAGQPAKKPAAKTDTPKADAKTATKQPGQPVVGRKFTVKEYKLAKTQLKTFCITCHGKSGKGDGLAALALNPKPRNWTDPKWHASVTDEQIFKVIKLGGEKNGLSKLMAPNPQYQDRPGVLHALVKLVRGFKGK